MISSSVMKKRNQNDVFSDKSELKQVTKYTKDILSDKETKIISSLRTDARYKLDDSLNCKRNHTMLGESNASTSNMTLLVTQKVQKINYITYKQTCKSTKFKNDIKTKTQDIQQNIQLKLFSSCKSCDLNADNAQQMKSKGFIFNDMRKGNKIQDVISTSNDTKNQSTNLPETSFDLKKHLQNQNIQLKSPSTCKSCDPNADNARQMKSKGFIFNDMGKGNKIQDVISQPSSYKENQTTNPPEIFFDLKKYLQNQNIQLKSPSTYKSCDLSADNARQMKSEEFVFNDIRKGNKIQDVISQPSSYKENQTTNPPEISFDLKKYLQNQNIQLKSPSTYKSCDLNADNVQQMKSKEFEINVCDMKERNKIQDVISMSNDRENQTTNLPGTPSDLKKYLENSVDINVVENDLRFRRRNVYKLAARVLKLSAHIRNLHKIMLEKNVSNRATDRKYRANTDSITKDISFKNKHVNESCTTSNVQDHFMYHYNPLRQRK